MSAYVKESKFNSIISSSKEQYYQDGILLPFEISSLFPMGFSRIKCNCTADARMKLNVTRHKPSELRQDTTEWLNHTGQYYQKEIFSRIVSAFDDLQLSANFNDLLWEYNNKETSYFEKEAYASLHNIIKEHRSD